MKKKHRDITVEGVKYAWTVTTNEYYNLVKICHNKKVVHEEKSPNPALIIAPGFVKEVILEYKEDWNI